MSTPARLSMYLDPLSPHYLKNENIENSRSYMGAHILLKLLNKLRKRAKMRDLQSILSLFCNEFNKFNNTRAQILNSIMIWH